MPQDRLPKDPYNPADDAARALARDILNAATYAALACLQPDTGFPTVTRITFATDANGRPVSLVSGLSQHTRALIANPACALLIGAPGEKGDPLIHPRLTLHARARFVSRGGMEEGALRSRFQAVRPKTKLYMELPDFRFVLFDVDTGLLNAGFGKAYLLTEQDLAMTI